MYFSDHKPDHIHAIYQNSVALFTLDGKLIKGKLPEAKFKIAMKFILDNQDLLIKMKETISKK